MKRVLLTATAIIMASIFSFASAEDTDCLGDYGCKHPKLHRHGSVDKIIEMTGTSCCDGGEGGECRASRIRYRDGKKMAFLNGVWCWIPESLDIRADVSLPPGVEAMICAERGAPGYCPAIYCAAANFGS